MGVSALEFIDEHPEFDRVYVVGSRKFKMMIEDKFPDRQVEFSDINVLYDEMLGMYGHRRVLYIVDTDSYYVSYGKGFDS